MKQQGKAHDPDKLAQIWDVLISVAESRRDSIEYGELGRVVGLNPHTELPHYLGPIQDYCLDGPPLTILVVNKSTRLPGAGFIGWPMADLNAGRLAVIKKDWRLEPNPWGESTVLIPEYTSGVDLDELLATGSEGQRKLVHHWGYERNPANRRKAIQKHGKRCMACDFDFNEAYGPEHADGYIEIHHTRPLYLGPRANVSIAELVPLCANCHRMVHKKRDHLLPISELQKMVRKN